MISPLLLHSLIAPFGLGIVLAVIVLSCHTSARIQVFVIISMLLAIYTLLEGVPAVPPVAAKQKLSFLIVGVAVAAVMASQLRLTSWLVPVTALAVGLAWLGSNKLANAEAWPAALVVLAPIMTAAFASRSLETRTAETFLWPATLLAFAIGGSLLSLLGFFVGFAQVMGAMAAWLGGYMLFQFALVATGRKANPLSPLALQAVLLCFVSMSFMVALFAPGASLPAYALLSLTLLVPQFAPRLPGVSAVAQPFAFGFLAAVPAVAAILIAFIQHGQSIG